MISLAVYHSWARSPSMTSVPQGVSYSRTVYYTLCPAELSRIFRHRLLIKAASFGHYLSSTPYPHPTPHPLPAPGTGAQDSDLSNGQSQLDMITLRDVIPSTWFLQQHSLLLSLCPAELSTIFRHRRLILAASVGDYLLPPSPHPLPNLTLSRQTDPGR